MFDVTVVLLLLMTFMPHATSEDRFPAKQMQVMQIGLTASLLFLLLELLLLLLLLLLSV